MTHAEAKAKFRRCRNKERGNLLAKHTRLQERGRAFAVRYHNTDVVMIRPDGTYRLNTGGWRTPTTKDRINRILPYCVSQRNGIWYAGDAYYTDGMLIGSDGKAIGAKQIPDIQKIKRNVDRRVRKFIKLVVQACIGRDIGTWKNHKTHIISRPANKTHTKQLWETIVTETKDDDRRASYPSHLFKLVHLAVVTSNLGNPEFIWKFMRESCLRGNPPVWAQHSLTRFMLPRKPLIAEMIVNGEFA